MLITGEHIPRAALSGSYEQLAVTIDLDHFADDERVISFLMVPRAYFAAIGSNAAATYQGGAEPARLF